jgi:hypothetical protein
MPYSIQQDGELLRSRFTGTLSGNDLHAMLDEVDRLLAPRERWPDNLLDLRALEGSSLGFTDVMSVAKRRESITPPNAIRTAIVADSPTLIGFARMFQSLNHNPNITIQIFSDPAEAEAWLAAAR